MEGIALKGIRIRILLIGLGFIGIQSCSNTYSEAPEFREAKVENYAYVDRTGEQRDSAAEFASVDFFPQFPALLASRFESLKKLRELVHIHYKSENRTGPSRVRLSYRYGNAEMECELLDGIRQSELARAVDGTFRERVEVVLRAPFAIRNRSDLNKVNRLARRRPIFFGEGDVAFYDLALASVDHITSTDLAYLNARDSSEKGYINTFNHITALAFITTYFSFELADFVGSVHERENMPELVTGKFSAKQLNDPDNNPVDNYVDLINNNLGQHLGEQLKKKFGIDEQTEWTPDLLADYLNDIQSFYSWSFGIGLAPFRPEDEVLIRFCEKINIISAGVPYRDI